MFSKAYRLHKVSPQSTDPVPLYSVYSKPQNVKKKCTFQKPYVYILLLTVHTVQRNWISRLGRYLMTDSVYNKTICKYKKKVMVNSLADEIKYLLLFLKT